MRTRKRHSRLREDSRHSKSPQITSNRGSLSNRQLEDARGSAVAEAMGSRRPETPFGIELLQGLESTEIELEGQMEKQTTVQIFLVS